MVHALLSSLYEKLAHPNRACKVNSCAVFFDKNAPERLH